MRYVEVTVGDRHFRFDIYKGYVAVNIKFYGYAEPRGPQALSVWNQLSDAQRNSLLHYVEQEVRDSWWDSVKSQLPDFQLSCDGRSGGYLTFERYTTSRVEELVEDAASEPCSVCDAGAGRDVKHVGPESHAAYEATLRNDTPPIPFPDALWELDCAGCKLPYHHHDGGRCPFQLGRTYAPHKYTGECLGTLEELEAAVKLVESNADAAYLKKWVDDTLEQRLLDYEAEGSSVADTDT